jgi:hypothetical protein
MRKIEDERTGNWDLSVAQLQSMVTQLEEEISDVRIDFCFDNLQEILDRVRLESESAVEDPFCLVFYDNKGKLWQLKECQSAGADQHRYAVDVSLAASMAG